jgi:hypothetical protein
MLLKISRSIIDFRSDTYFNIYLKPNNEQKAQGAAKRSALPSECHHDSKRHVEDSRGFSRHAIPFHALSMRINQTWRTYIRTFSDVVGACCVA